MKSKRFILGLALILSAMVVSSCKTATVEPTTVGLANPASVYCEAQGYTLEMRTDADGGQYGVCIFPDGGECEEWAFYRGECSPGGPPTEEQPTETPATPSASSGQAAPTVEPTEQPTLVESGLRPLDPAACGDLANAVVQTLGVEAAMAEAPFQDRVGGETGTGCQVTATGTGLDFEDHWIVFQELAEMLTAQGWREDMAYQGGGPTGTLSGFRRNGELCLLLVGWDPSEDADCPTDQPIGMCELTPEQRLYTIVLDCAQGVSPSAPTGEPVACWYGRVDSAPPDAAIEDYLVLLPEEARRAVDVVGADEAVEAEIVALRDSGTYAHFWGRLDCDAPAWGGCRLVVDRLRPEGPGFPFFDPDPVEGWTGSVFGTPTGAQFDNYFVRSGNIPMRYGIDSADAAISAQLENLNDAAVIVRVWGQVTCPAIDFQGSQIQVDRLEIVMEASAEAGYEGWKPYLNETFGYALWYPGGCTVMGANLDESIQFVGPLVDDEHWPVLTVSHRNCDFCRPPVGTDVGKWLDDVGIAYDEIVEIAGFPAAHFRQDTGPGAYPSDGYYFIRGDQLFFVSILHAGWQEDWELYNKFLQCFTFP
jgi:putative hemolysin